MDQDTFKQMLLEVIGENERGRKWFFPKNVDNQYKVIANMTLKELGMYILPAFLISLLIGFIPPYSSIGFWFVKFVFIILVLFIPIFYVSFRPVKQRDNIRSKDFLKEYITYKNKKKIYYLKPKDRGLYNK